MAISKIIYKTSPNDTGTVWMDATPATATASDITAPKTAMLADGVLTTGTGSGGGGGLEYEEGTWTPTEDIYSTWIQFTNTHATLPMYVCIADATGTYDGTISSMVMQYICIYAAFSGVPTYTSTTSLNYARGQRIYRTSATGIGTATITFSQPLTEPSASSTNYPRYWVTESQFKANDGTTYFWQAGRTYKWIAVWA